MAVVFQEGYDHIQGTETNIHTSNCTVESVVNVANRICGNGCLVLSKTIYFKSTSLYFENMTVTDISRGRLGFWFLPIQSFISTTNVTFNFSIKLLGVSNIGWTFAIQSTYGTQVLKFNVKDTLQNSYEIQAACPLSSYVNTWIWIELAYDLTQATPLYKFYVNNVEVAVTSGYLPHTTIMPSNAYTMIQLDGNKDNQGATDCYFDNIIVTDNPMQSLMYKRGLESYIATIQTPATPVNNVQFWLTGATEEHSGLLRTDIYGSDAKDYTQGNFPSYTSSSFLPKDFVGQSRTLPGTGSIRVKYLPSGSSATKVFSLMSNMYGLTSGRIGMWYFSTYTYSMGSISVGFGNGNDNFVCFDVFGYKSSMQLQTRVGAYSSFIGEFSYDTTALHFLELKFDFNNQSNNSVYVDGVEYPITPDLYTIDPSKQWEFRIFTGGSADTSPEVGLNNIILSTDSTVSLYSTLYKGTPIRNLTRYPSSSNVVYVDMKDITITTYEPTIHKEQPDATVNVDRKDYSIVTYNPEISTGAWDDIKFWWRCEKVNPSATALDVWSASKDLWSTSPATIPLIDKKNPVTQKSELFPYLIWPNITPPNWTGNPPNIYSTRTWDGGNTFLMSQSISNKIAMTNKGRFGFWMNLQRYAGTPETSYPKIGFSECATEHTHEEPLVSFQVMPNRTPTCIWIVGGVNVQIGNLDPSIHTIPLFEWHFYELKWDASLPYYALYIDGVLINSKAPRSGSMYSTGFNEFSFRSYGGSLKNILGYFRNIMVSNDPSRNFYAERFASQCPSGADMKFFWGGGYCTPETLDTTGRNDFASNNNTLIFTRDGDLTTAARKVGTYGMQGGFYGVFNQIPGQELGGIITKEQGKMGFWFRQRTRDISHPYYLFAGFGMSEDSICTQLDTMVVKVLIGYGWLTNEVIATIAFNDSSAESLINKYNFTFVDGEWYFIEFSWDAEHNTVGVAINNNTLTVSSTEGTAPRFGNNKLRLLGYNFYLGTDIDNFMITDDVSRNLYDLRNYPRYPANNDPINTTVNVDRKDKTLTTYNPTITVSGSGFELSATKDHYTGTPAITTPMSEPDTVTQRVGNAAIKVICPQGQEGHCFTIGNFSTTTSQTGRIGFWLKANPVQDAHVDTVYCGPCTFSFYKDYEGSNVIDCYFSQDMTTYTVSNMEQWNFYEYWWEVSYDVETEEYSYVTDLLINGNSYGGFNGTSWDPISGVSNFILEGWCAAEAESLIFEVDNIMVCIDTATDLYGISEATRWSDILDDRVQFYFRCDVAQQITPLSVSDTDPDNGGTVPIGGYSVFVYFNKALSFYDDSITINNGTPFTPIYDDVLQALVFDVSTEYSQRYDIDVLANQVIDIDDQPLGNTYEFFFLCEEDPTPFSVSYTEPYDGESDVNPAAIVTAYFEGPYPIDPSTINYDTFQLLDSESQLVEGEHSATITAVFTPLSHLTYEETYTVNLTSGVKDSHGRALPPYTSTFTIMSDPYLHLSSHEPPSDTAVPIGITNVSLVFDKPLISYENCVILNDTEYPILTYDDQYTLSFDVDVEYDGTYKVQVVAGVVIADDDSTLSEDAIFTFYGEAPPLEYMHLLETDPTDTAEDVPVDKSCIATFDYEIDSATILDNVMLVDSEYNPIDCNIYSDYNIIHIDPISDLSPGTLYYMGFNTGLLSVEGFSLENIQTPSFTTISDQPVDVNIDVDMKDINIERYYVTIVPERNVVVNTITKNITIEAYDPDINISDKPVITNVVGVFSPGETITIIGNTFGSKIQAAPLKWSNFNDGEDGVQLNTIDPTWVKYNPIGAYYSNVEAHSGDLSVRTNIGTTELFQTNYHQFTPSDEVYLTYWYRTANLPTGTSITSNIKMTRLNSSVASGGGGVYNGIGATTMSNMSASVPEGPYASYSVNGTEENGLEDFRRLDVPFNEWSRIEFYKKLSTPDVANGEVRATCVGRDELVGLNVVNRSSAHVYLNDTVLLGLMEGNDCAGRNYQIYIDDVYIDNTRSRIEIGDSSTWETCTHREILIPTSWSDTSIEGTFNVGSFNPGDTVYVYVVNSDGSVNETGYEIQITPDIIEIDYMEYPTNTLAQEAYVTNGTSGGTELYNMPLFNDEHLISYYRFEGNVNDSKGSNTGTATNVTYQSGKFGLAAGYETYGGIQLPTSITGTIGTGDFTFNGWFYFVDPGLNYPVVFISLNITPPLYSGPSIFYDPNNTLSHGDAMIVRLTSENQQFITSPSASSLYNSWVMISFTRESGNCKVYYDGHVVIEFYDNTNILVSDQIYVCGRGSLAIQAFRPGMKGDDCSYFNRALTQEEIIDLYDSYQCYSESLIKTQENYSLKCIAQKEYSYNKTLTKTIEIPLNLSNQNVIKFDVRSTEVGNNIKIGFRNSDLYLIEATPIIVLANEWQTESIDISGIDNGHKNEIDRIIITTLESENTNTFYLDNIYASTEIIHSGLYVSPTGSGSEYTYEHPGDAKAGIALAQAGDSVIFLDGVYIDPISTWESAFNVSRSGTEENPITLRSYNPRGAILTRRNNNMPSMAIEHYDYIVIDGFKSEGMIHALDAHHTTIKNCEVIKGSIQGGDVSLHWGIGISGSSNCLVQNNWVHDMENIGNHGHNGACIMIFGSYTDNLTNDNIVEYNTVDGSYPDGSPNNIYCAYGEKSGYVHRTIYRYNFATNCYAGFFGIASSGDSGFNDGWNVYQNVIVNCNTCFYSYDGSRNMSVYNNTFYGTQFMHKPDYYPNPTVEDRNFKIFNNLFIGDYCIAVEKSSVDWSYLLEYSDYNRGQTNTAWGWSYGGNMTLATWRTTTGKDGNSLNTTPNFINSGGVLPEDYKRTSYPTDGRGGIYSNVMGAYITGSETIGCDFVVYESVFYVSPTGSDETGDGSIENPWATPVYGASQMTEENTTLYIREGIYNIDTNPLTGCSIYPRANHCTIKGYPNEIALLQGSADGHYGVAPTGGVIGNGNHSYITIEDLTIKGVVVLHEGSYNTLQNCDISVGCDVWEGIKQGEVVWIQGDTAPYSNYFTIRNCKLHDNGVSEYGGNNAGLIMAYRGSNGIIENCDFYNSKGPGITLKDTLTNITIRYNYFYNNDRAGIITANQGTPSGIYVYQNIFNHNNLINHEEEGGFSERILTQNIWLYNNTFYNNLDCDFRKSCVGDMPTTFFNNISVSPSAYHLNSRYGNFTFDYIDYNNYYARLVWRNVNTTYTSLSAWRTFIQTLLSGAESHSIVTNPNFINASGTYLLATDFKRSSYPTDGRGGSYPSVMGAYVTGDEQIGSDLPKYFYVSTTGSDTTGDGSYFNPWATPEKAFSMATAGYIVYFREGEYTLTSTTDFGYVGHNGTAESPIIFSGYPGETASINCNALMATGEVGPIYVRNKTYNFFEDLTFSNYKTCINFETADGGGIINCNGSTTLKDSLGNNDGFAHIHTSTNILIQNNTVVGPGLTGLSGTFACMVLFGNCNGLKILNNKCGNAPNGIYYKHGWPEPISPITMEIAGNFITSSTQNPLGGNMNYCKIHDNIIGPGCGMGGMTFCNDNGWIGGNYNEIYHNTICANTAVGYDAISMGINYEGHEEPPQMKGEWGQYNTVRDNLFTKKVYYYAYAPTDVSFNITADYNLFPASSVVVGYEGSQMSLEDWNIISEQDLNSVTGTPIFVGSDFSQIPSYELTEESPGKNAASDGKDMGADVSLVGCK